MSSHASLAGEISSSLAPHFDNISNINESATQDDALDYHYDLEESLHNYNLGELIPVTLVYGLTLLAGIIGNTLVVFSIARYRRMRSITNIFLVSLASADLLVVIICVPIKVGKHR